MSIRLRDLRSGDDLVIVSPAVVVAGYTGRDRAAVEHHIEELARIGVPRPDSVPAYFPMPAGLLTTDRRLSVEGTRTSGEVEPVYIRHNGSWYLGVGSDHTDREREATSIQHAKACCPKPIGGVVAAISADPHAIDTGFDDIEVSSTLDGHTYQSGYLSALRLPSDVLSGVLTHHDPAPEQDLVVFGGTIPVDDGEFRYGEKWSMSLTCEFGRLEMAYDITTTGKS